MSRTHRVPLVLQMEAAECGAASLAMILAGLGRWVTLEELREACGVSRDGSKASNILRAAREYGLQAKGFRKSVDALRDTPLPAIVHWNFNHFVVVERFEKGRVALADPALGRRFVDDEVFDECFTGVTLTFEPTEDFKPGGAPPPALTALLGRLKGAQSTVLLLTIVSLFLVVPGLLVPTLTRVFIDDVLIAGRDDWLRPVLMGLAFAAVLEAGLSHLRNHQLLRLFTRLSVVSTARFIWHVVELPIPFFLARYAGDVASRAQVNDRVARLVSERLSQAGMQVILMVAFAALLLTYDPLLTLAVVGLAVLHLTVVWATAETRKEANQHLQQEVGTMSGVSMAGLQGIETIKSTGAEGDFFSKWAGHFAKVQNASLRLGIKSQILGAAPLFFDGLTFACIITLGGHRVMSGEMTVGLLVAYQTVALAFLGPVHDMAGLWGRIQTSDADLRRLKDVLDHPVAPELEGIAASAGLQRLSGQVHIRKLTFGYARHESPLIEDLDLTLEPGQRVALVGGSGSGKSTVARLLAGLYAPWSGEILFDGHPRAAVERMVLCRDVAQVDQDVFLFEGTVRQNLSLWDVTVLDRDMVRAAQDAEIHSVVAERPEAYDSRVLEDGRNFSGGQRQRLEIARALVTNPAVLILDEATSALDPKTEQLIDDNIRKRGCTCLIVAHRLSTIRDCDQIIVMDKGRIVERGTHTELMEVNEHYVRLMGTT